MISLRRASKEYHQNARVLHRVSLDWKLRDFLFIVGSSGAGKTTLLKMLSGEEAPTDGEALLEGHYSLSTDCRKILQLRRRMGIIYQDLRLLGERTIYENIVFPLYFGRAGTGVARIHPFSRRAKKLAHGVCEQVGIPLKNLSAPLRELSGGEKQRVAIARAIVNNPDFLIADEPTGSLDYDNTWKVMDLFQKLNLQGMSIIIATHDREIVRKVCKPTCVLNQGGLYFEKREGTCIF